MPDPSKVDARGVRQILVSRAAALLNGEINTYQAATKGSGGPLPDGRGFHEKAGLCQGKNLLGGEPPNFVVPLSIGPLSLIVGNVFSSEGNEVVKGGLLLAGEANP
jgi:hypothetical protein